ncbi:efflux RND transporter periplasmic adaptor subunit [Bradyrhizobium genosp. A]|uniref:efflux RND transporter periplasmic adaptor subunit n=1 Tax=Bradyrhizobium genosp. A TaxID=83626 RepID=UPI003CFA8798
MSRIIAALLRLGLAVLAPHAASAQGAPGSPAVGVVEVAKRSITEKTEFLGRIEAINRVNIFARVTAFMEKRLFTEGSEVSANDQLYLLERGPFQADLDAKRAQVAQLEATLANAKLMAERQRILLSGPAGVQANYDTAISNQKSLEAQVKAAEAQVNLSRINLDYTDIRSPIDGKVGRTAVTEGNVVSPNTGSLTTIVSQDPMYVTFPISVRQALVLRERYGAKGVRDAVVVVLRLPDGRIYGQAGHLDFESNSISQGTDTLLLRGTIPNPLLYSGSSPVRELTDGELVTVVLEGAQPIEVPAIPRAAVLSDQQGNYVLLVGAENKVEQRRIRIGQSTTTVASVVSGLSIGDKVIVEGIQRTGPGQVVTPGPASAGIEAAMNRAERDGPAQGASQIGNTSTAQRAATPNGG